jgi:hypothetical protein
LDLASSYEPFDEQEFEQVCRDIVELKGALQAAENDEEYTPLFGTADGEERRSTNF